MRLFKDQFLYFWQLIKVRFLSWLLLICLFLLVAGGFMRNGRSANIMVFQGLGLAEIRAGIRDFPVLWFGYFFFPLMISLNIFKELWISRVMQLRGQQIKPSHFSWVNVILQLLLAAVYVLASNACLWLKDLLCGNSPLVLGPWQGGAAELHWMLIAWLGVSSLLLIQASCSELTPALGLIMPIVLLVSTSLTAWSGNPLNVLMLSRWTSDAELFMFVWTLIWALLYVLVDSKHGWV